MVFTASCCLSLLCVCAKALLLRWWELFNLLVGIIFRVILNHKKERPYRLFSFFFFFSIVFSARRTRRATVCVKEEMFRRFCEATALNLLLCDYLLVIGEMPWPIANDLVIFLLLLKAMIVEMQCLYQASLCLVDDVHEHWGLLSIVAMICFASCRAVCCLL